MSRNEETIKNRQQKHFSIVQFGELILENCVASTYFTHKQSKYQLIKTDLKTEHLLVYRIEAFSFLLPPPPK